MPESVAATAVEPDDEKAELAVAATKAEIAVAPEIGAEVPQSAPTLAETRTDPSKTGPDPARKSPAAVAKKSPDDVSR